MSKTCRDDCGDAAATIEEFHKAVNMTAAKIEHWLDSAESKEVGSKASEGGDSVGHHSGRRIIEILGKNHAALDSNDLAI